MWGSLSGLAQAASGAILPDTPKDTAATNETSEDGAPAEDAAPAEGEAPETSNTGLWGSLTQIAGGIQTAVEEQIAIQTAEMEKEQVQDILAAPEPPQILTSH